MALLILRNTDDFEIGRREMQAEERYAIYRAYFAGELFAWGQGRYRLHTVAWRYPQPGHEDELVVSVTFDSWAPVELSVDD